jgi:hypothetical protein
VIEGEQEGGAMTAPAEGSAQGGAAEAIYDRRWGRMASLATGHAGKLPTLGLAAGLSGGRVRDWRLDQVGHLQEAPASNRGAQELCLPDPDPERRRDG